jgi:PAS domain S-box-containing protein
MTEGLQLFLIEDDDALALLISKALGRAGHAVTRCRSAADALIVLSHGAFDLVLLSQRLPDLDGLALLHVMAREGIGVPCILLTASGEEPSGAESVRAGAVDHVVRDAAGTFLAELPKRVGEAVTRYRLQQNNRLLIAALESAHDGIMITDLQGVILHVNQALEQMTGYTRRELIGQNPRLLKSGVHEAERYEEIWRSILARTSWQGELTNRRKDDSLIEVSLAVSPIVDAQGRLTHFVGIHRDITELRHLERQLLQAQKMQSIGTLAGGVAHEFNNLLAGINGYASLGLRQPGVTEPVHEFFQHITSLSDRAAGLTRRLLTFARKPALTRQPTDIADLVRSTVELAARTLLVDVGTDIEQTDNDVPPIVEADANQLQQALINLALNARDALGDEKTIKRDKDEQPITFRVRRRTLLREQPAFPQNIPPGDYIAVEVADQGCGMTTEVLGQSLDPFFTTKEVGKGTGLGLPMVFGIVQGHQGHLCIETAPGSGTCVGLYLPRLADLGSRIETGRFEAGEVLEPENVQGRSILVADDEGAVQDVVRRFLELAGHQVTCVSSGREALEVVAKGRKVDLLILDLMMPREDGAKTFRQIRHDRPHLPVLLCTGLPEAEPTPDLLRSGAAGILRKPFRMNELWYAVNQALNAKESANGR